MSAAGSSRRVAMSILISGVLIAGMVGAYVSAGGGVVTGLAQKPENLVRLHVLPHSDAPHEQQVKLAVRDALLVEMTSWARPQSAEDLERLLRASESGLVRVAEGTLAEHGFAHPVRVEIGDFAFDERRTGDVTLPAGTYRAVRVVIGDGAGRNWWCVLFPPLCFVDDGADVEIGDGGGRIAAANRLVYDRSIAHAAPAVTPDSAKPEPDSPVQVQWRLRLWESISGTTYADALRDLLLISAGRER